MVERYGLARFAVPNRARLARDVRVATACVDLDAALDSILAEIPRYGNSRGAPDPTPAVR